MRIFANHAHVYQSGIMENGSVDDLKRIMSECGIDRAVAFAPLPGDYRNDGLSANEWLHSQIRNEPDIVGFGTIDFAAGGLRDQVDRLFQLGMKGVKIHPAEQRLPVAGPEAFEIYRRAEELGLVVSFHTGVHWHRIADYHMLLFDEVGYHFPDLRYTLEHVGGYSFFTDAVAVMINNKNAYAGITSVFDRDTNKFWHLDDRQIGDLLWLTGCERSIFGLDFPWNGPDKISFAINKIISLDIPEQEKAKILGGNLSALLGVLL